MRQQVYIDRSILTRPRLSRARAIVSFGLSIAIAGICACHHSEPASSAANPIAGRWQAEIPGPVGLQQCVMEIGDMGQIAYGDSCPMPLTGQQATVTTVPNGAYAPNLYLTGKDSGTFVIMGGSGITGMVGAFRVEGSKHLETRTAPGADIEWTRSSSQAPMRSAAASRVLPGQVQWPVSGVPAIAQRALAYVRTKWQPDAFLTSIQMELTTALANAQSPAGGVLIQFNFYSPGQQQTLTFMPNSPAGELMPGSSADPNDQRAMPVNFMDLPDAVSKLRAKGLRGKQIKTVHIENYGRGSYAGSLGLFGPEWVIDSAIDERGAVLAELPDRGGDARISGAEEEAGDESQAGSGINVKIAGLRNNEGQVYCWLFTSGQDFPSNSQGNAASTAGTITNRRAECDFESEDPGSYAILVFHDEGSTHTLELNPNGTPREGVGLSNNPNISGAVPGYDAAMFTYRSGPLKLTINVQYPASAQSVTAGSSGGASLTGFAFVGSSVTAQGHRANLPAGTKIYPPGSRITGTDGCPTNRYNTDGMIVAVIDYQGRPTAGSVAVTRHPASGGQFDNAPYYLDLDPGRTLQFLGPIFENGSYDIHLQYDFSLGKGKTAAAATFVLARSCPPTR
jgi:uncharacterized protein (DUF2141 family)